MDSLSRITLVANPLATDSLATKSIPAEMVFGEGSRLVSTMSATPAMDKSVTMSGDATYGVTVLLIVILYFIWIGRSLANLTNVKFKVSNPFAKIVDVDGLGGSIRIGDILLDWVLVVMLCALFTTKLIDILQLYLPEFALLAQRISSFGIWLWVVLVGVAFLSIMFWGIIIVNTMGYLIRSEWISRGIMTLKSRLLKMSVVWLLPFVLLSAFEVETLYMSYLSVTLAVMFLLIYLYRSFMLFISQKISILHWILYLCAVEIFPVTFLWAIFVR